jgi:hypothetical protein
MVLSLYSFLQKTKKYLLRYIKKMKLGKKISAVVFIIICLLFLLGFSQLFATPNIKEGIDIDPAWSSAIRAIIPNSIAPRFQSIVKFGPIITPPAGKRRW